MRWSSWADTEVRPYESHRNLVYTIRVSGYAVKFIDLTREQQMDVISRTCHAAL